MLYGAASLLHIDYSPKVPVALEVLDKVGASLDTLHQLLQERRLRNAVEPFIVDHGENEEICIGNAIGEDEWSTSATPGEMLLEGPNVARDVLLHVRRKKEVGTGREGISKETTDYTARMRSG